jgi:polyhydroxyalkanoate synthesis repressor PhaR
MSVPRIIKKYTNRRLYDTVERRYITLDQVKKMVLKQTPFKIIDNKTQQEVTQAILLQVLCDQESQQTPFFTTHILENMIRFYNSPFQANIRQWLEQYFSYLNQNSEEKMKESAWYFESFMEKTQNSMEAFAKTTKKQMEVWESILKKHKE